MTDSRDLDYHLFRRTPPEIDINHCALLVIDMQEYFRPLAQHILVNLKSVIQSCRVSNLPVIYTYHAHENLATDAGMLGNWWQELIMDHTPNAKILPEIQPRPDEKIIHKKRYSAFYQTSLDSYLKLKNIRQLMISGVMTNLCCETTARDAFVRDYEVFFLSDGTASSHENFHRATLLNLAFGFAYVVQCDEIWKQLEKRNRANAD